MNDFNFSVLIEEQPTEMLEQYVIPVIEKETRGYLKASLNEYEGKIRSYVTHRTNFLASNVFGEEKQYHDIQNDLGELNKKYYTFELVIESEKLASYKYRVLFLRYGEACYPATVVVAEAISRELDIQSNGEKPYIYDIHNSREMKELIDKIMNSNTFNKTLQEAITASIISEKRKDDSTKES